jgi:hypothetical protein
MLSQLRQVAGTVHRQFQVCGVLDLAVHLGGAGAVGAVGELASVIDAIGGAVVSSDWLSAVPGRLMTGEAACAAVAAEVMYGLSLSVVRQSASLLQQPSYVSVEAHLPEAEDQR